MKENFVWMNSEGELINFMQWNPENINDSGLKNELEWIMTMNDFKTRNANA